jgi:hypothetical protein
MLALDPQSSLLLPGLCRNGANPPFDREPRHCAFSVI